MNVQSIRDAEINAEREYMAAIERFDRYQEAVERGAAIERQVLLSQTIGDVLDHMGRPLGSQLDDLVNLIASDLARARLEVVK